MEEREVPQQQVQDFLVREYGLFLWLEEALVEDEALHELITSGSPTIVRGPNLYLLLVGSDLVGAALLISELFCNFLQY
jgi:hypothetical protein